MQNVKSASFTCLLVVVAALFAPPVSSQTNIYNTIADGNWTANSTWQNGASGKPPTSGNCDCIININTGHRVTINQNINISNAKIILMGAGSEIRFSSEVVFAQTMQLTGTSSIELRDAGANIQSTSNLFGYNGNSISINGTVVFQGYSTRVNSSTRGVVSGPAGASSSMSPPMFINALLPVRLLSFAAHMDRGNVALRWTAGEFENFDHFEMERSANGRDWRRIGDIQYGGASYSFKDVSPVDGTNYYRLKMVDIDRQFSYSKVAAVNVSVMQAEVKVFPNPVSKMLHISVVKPGKRNYYVELINLSGRVIVRRTYTSSDKILIDVHLFPRGQYFVRVAESDGSPQVCTILIVR